MKRFEYKIEQIHTQFNAGKDFNTLMTEKLNALGKEGWELAGVNGTIYYFKKEI